MTLRIHHLDCGTMVPLLAGRVLPERLVAHCLLLERPEGLVLVDTGFGTADIADPRRLGPGFARMVGLQRDTSATALARVRALGHDPRDVTDVVLTHLDLDHAGGIADFPQARVHVLADELAAARARRTPAERNRYRTVQWAHGPRWVEHRSDAGTDWFGLTAVPVLDGTDDLVVVPLAGHTRGHAGVGVRRPDGGWLLHAGDAYFSAAEKVDPAAAPRSIRVLQTLLQVSGTARRTNQERLRTLYAEHGPAGSGDLTMFCAHDAAEFAALARIPGDDPSHTLAR